MKNIATYLSMIAILALSSCQDTLKTDRILQNGDRTVITASTEEGGVRTSLNYNSEDNQYDVLWSEGDRIVVMLSNSHGESRHVFTLVDGAGQTSASFACPDAIDWSEYSSVRAYYGYDGTSWPSEQTSDGGNSISNVPMYALVENFSGNSAPALTFRNAGGILKVGLKGFSIVKEIRVESTDRISGAIGSYSSNAAVLNTAVPKETTITLAVPAGVKLDKEVSKSFNIALPQRTSGYSGVKITVVDDMGNEFVKSLKSDKKLVIERSIITPSNLPAIEIDGTCKHGTLGLVDGREAVIFKPLNESVGDTYINLAVGTVNEAESASRENVCWYAAGNTYFYNVMNNSYGTVNPRTDPGYTSWGLPSEMELRDLVNYLKDKGSWDSTRKGLSITFGDHEFFLPACGKANNGAVNDNGATGYYWTNTMWDVYNYPKDVEYVTFSAADAVSSISHAAPSKSCAMSVRLVRSL